MKGHDSLKNSTRSTHVGEVNRGSVGAGLISAYPVSGKKARRSSSPSVVALSEPAPPLSHKRIAERARALWLASGCVPGRDEENWHEAEDQLRAELKSG